MEPRKATIDDLSGGLNEGQPAGTIADNETTVLQNFFPFRRKLIRRGGSYPLSRSAYYELLTTAFTFRPEVPFGSRESNADWLIFGGQTGLARLLPGGNLGESGLDGRVPPSGGTYGMVEPLGGPRLTSDDMPWSMHQYKSIGYAMRRNAGLMRFNHKQFGTAGIAQPAAPTVVEGGAGSLTAATYKCVVTGYNTETGAESNPSAPGTVTIAASKQINWSNIATFSESQVNARRLYRTLPDAEGVYLFIAQIDDNTTTTYIDDVAIADMGDFVSFDNDLAPSGLLFGEFWQERLFATDGTDLLYSEQFLPESWSGDNVVRVFPDNGMPITGIRAADQNKLIVAKRNAMHYLTPAGSGFARDTLDQVNGCVSPFSLRTVGNLILWFAGHTFYRSLGGPAEDIAAVKLKRTLDHVDPATYDRVVSAIFPKYEWYITALRVDNGYVDPTGSRLTQFMNNVLVCYNYRTGAWCKFTLPTGGPVWIGEAYDARGAQILQMTLYNKKFYQFDRGFTDDGQSITAIARTKAYRLGVGGLLAAIRRFFILGKTARAKATYRLYKNQSETAAKERTQVTLYESDGSEASWKGANLSTLRDPGGEWQWEIEYGGVPEFEIEQLALEVVPLARPVRIR